MGTCMHAGANWSALRTPFHDIGACGGRQRKSPTGGAAKGMPLYVVIPSAIVPWSNPDCTCTGFDVCASNPDTEASAVQTNARVLKVLIFNLRFPAADSMDSSPPFISRY